MLQTHYFPAALSSINQYAETMHTTKLNFFLLTRQFRTSLLTLRFSLIYLKGITGELKSNITCSQEFPAQQVVKGADGSSIIGSLIGIANVVDKVAGFMVETVFVVVVASSTGGFSHPISTHLLKCLQHFMGQYI